MTTVAVRLHDHVVGHLAFARGSSGFAFDPSYVNLPSRPVLSQSFEQRGLARPVRQANGIPGFFSHLLPAHDGPLHRLLAGQHRFKDDFELLEILGRDLPGAVTIASVTRGPDPLPVAAHPVLGELRFSLAGMFLKLPANLDPADRLMVPAYGVGGRWILKFPSLTMPDITVVESLMLRWARGCGLNVPDHQLVLAGQVGNLPPDVAAATPLLAVKRFDRNDLGTPVHAEDFAQALGLPNTPRGLYELVSYSNLAQLVATLAQAQDRVEFCRRLVFMVLSGNGDAHTKNWGILYPDQRTAVLAPAYDLVCTRLYPNAAKDELALSLRGKRAGKAWADATREHVLAVFQVAGVDATTAQDVLEQVCLAAPAALERAVEESHAAGLNPDKVQSVRSHLVSALHNLQR